jgi:hypothetical protein
MRINLIAFEKGVQMINKISEFAPLYADDRIEQTINLNCGGGL